MAKSHRKKYLIGDRVTGFQTANQNALDKKAIIINFEENLIMPILIGNFAPDFILTDESGTSRRLSDYRGQYVVLYFYPKDDTPGCTTEACNFRDDYSAYVEAGVSILGVSPDSQKSHDKFKKKFQLPFPLLSDTEHTVCEAYEVWGQKKFMGREYMGVLRTTFIIAPDGKVKKVYENVKPAAHSLEVLAAIKE